MNVPKLRFKEFTGEWKEKSFRDIVSLNLVPTEKPSSDYVRLGIRSHCKGTFHELVKIENVLEADKMFLVPKDNLILNITFAWEHAIAITDENDEGKYVSGRFPTFSFKSKELPAFYESIIRSKRMKYELGVASPGGAGRNRVLNKELFLDIPVNTTNIEEQTKISNFIRCVDDKIKNQKDIIESLEKQKKGLMQKIFSQELRFKDDDGKEFPTWEEKKLGEVVLSISSGKNKYRDDFGKFPVYGSTGKIGYANKVEYSGEMLLIARVGANAGLLNYIDEECGVSDNTLVIKMQEKYNTKYFFYVLQEYNLNKLTFGSGQPLVTSSMIKNILIFIPSECEQNKITEFLTRIDFRIKNAQEQLEHWQQIKKGLLQQMFV